MNLRSVSAWIIGNKPISDAIDYITKRINLIWSVQHDPDTGLHTFAGATTPFDPGAFFGNGTLTITGVTQNTYRWGRVGTWVFVDLLIVATAAGAGGQVSIRLPQGVAPKFTVSTVGWAFDNAAGTTCIASVQPGVATIDVSRTDLANWTPGPIQIRVVLLFEG